MSKNFIIKVFKVDKKVDQNQFNAEKFLNLLKKQKH